MTVAAARLALPCILVLLPASVASTFCHEDGRPWEQWEAGPDRYYRLFETPQLWPEADRQVKSQVEPVSSLRDLAPEP